MTNNLYEEAIADAKKLRELAEQNAKNAIIESITPKIRDLIESQIMGDIDDSDLDTDILEEVAVENSNSPEEYDITPSAAKELREMMGSPAEEPLLESQDTPQQNKIVEVSNQLVAYNEYVDALEDVMSKIRGTDPAELNETDLKKYVALVAVSKKSCQKLDYMLESTERLSVFESVMKSTQDKIQDFKKEIKEMKRSLRDLLSEEVITIELDLGEDAEVDSSEISVKVIEEVPDEEILSAEAGDEDEELEVEDEVDEVEVEELEEMILELDDDMEEMDHVEEDAEEDAMMEGLDDDTVLEIDENMLREELAKLMQESEPTAEEILEEETTAEPVATEQNDELQAELESYQSAVTDLKSQLAEMSLFNAKLLYTNKLLMNSDLSQAQRAQAIETLDDAASLREVKLLFKTLTESFSKRAEVKTSSRNIGGASRPTKSASMKLNEATEANRWALLAGIK